MFFARIMKEHALFLEAGFTPANAQLGKTAEEYKKQFEVVLHNAFQLGNGIITAAAATSGEFVTDYTLGCELKTQSFTGIPINTDITRQQSRLWGMENPTLPPATVEHVKRMNSSVMPLLDGFIAFKRQVLNEVLSCNIFVAHYPLELDHLLREANMYKTELASLESGRSIDSDLKASEVFWNQIMMEHALFMRGLLDPSENNLIRTANDFAQDYAVLLRAAKEASAATVTGVTGRTLAKTEEFRGFKEAGVKGIAECRVRSMILPLLADHVLREANYYLRILKRYSNLLNDRV